MYAGKLSGNVKNIGENMDNTNSKKYWNEYVTYWEDKVKDANTNEKAKDKTNDDVILEEYFKKLRVQKEDIILDYGCGSCWLYPIYKKAMGKAEGNYCGIDVSKVCLEHAQEVYQELKVNKNLIEFDGEHIPFDNNFFDKIICFGVFDACNQEAVIRELLRVLRINGELLITGKNNNYFDDDNEAVVAEINARKKEHPNYFTDVQDMTEQLLEHKAKVIETFYFLRRGDFPKNMAVKEMPENFYEWAYVIEKTENYKDFEYKVFSSKYSRRNIK